MVFLFTEAEEDEDVFLLLLALLILNLEEEDRRGELKVELLVLLPSCLAFLVVDADDTEDERFLLVLVDAKVLFSDSGVSIKQNGFKIG